MWDWNFWSWFESESDSGDWFESESDSGDWFESESDSGACFQAAYQKIRETNNWVAQETIQVIENDEISVRPLRSMTRNEYEEIKDDPSVDRFSFLRRLLGLFVYPSCIFVETNQSEHDLERTIVHEIQHYRNRDLELTITEDELSACEAEDRYSGRYITRNYMRELRERIGKLD
jgi:hypothetical protein